MKLARRYEKVGAESESEGPGFRLESYAPQFAIAIGGLFLTVRIFSVSGQQLETALGILSAAGPLSVAIGTILSLLRVVWIFVSLGLVFAIVTYKSTLFVWPLLVGYFLLPAPLDVMLGIIPFRDTNIYLLDLNIGDIVLPVILAIPILLFIYRSVEWQGRFGGRIAHYIGAAALAISTITVVLVASSERPWLPAVRVDVSGFRENEVFVGYIIGSDESFITLLNHEPRRIVELRRSEVLERTPCRVEGTPRSLGSLVQGIPIVSRAFSPNIVASEPPCSFASVRESELVPIEPSDQKVAEQPNSGFGRTATGTTEQ